MTPSRHDLQHPELPKNGRTSNVLVSQIAHPLLPYPKIEPSLSRSEAGGTRYAERIHSDDEEEDRSRKIGFRA